MNNLTYIVTRTPLRVSFFGGGTDFPEYFNSKKTRVIGTSINKYIYVFQNKFYSSFFDHNLRIFYRKNEFVKKIKDIKHQVFRQSGCCFGVHGTSR
jgi:D-glycero-alpha-D-manno-heptose-7-phosphate kinase